MEVIKLNKIKYYNSVDIKKEHPKIFYKCTTLRAIIDMQDLKENEYCFAYIKDKKWISSNKTYFKAKLLLTVDCFNKLLDNINVKKKVDVDSSDDEADTDNEDESSDDEIDNAPNILHLKDSEKFVDNKGAILEIEARGTRECKNCYFSVYDISKRFKMPQLQKTITQGNTGYKCNTDYKYFIIGACSINKKTKNSNKKLFLTYKGLLRLLMCSKSDTVTQYVEWATNTLFTAQLGTKEQKQILINKLGATPDVVKSLTKTSISTIPCVYVFVLGTVKELRKSMNIHKKYTDDLYVCKSGRTDNLGRRTEEHKKTFEDIKGSTLCLKYYCYIDPTYVSQAESHMISFYKKINVMFEYKNHKELIIVDKKTLDNTIKRELDLLNTSYSGMVSNVNDTIKQLQHEMEIMKLQHKCEMNEKDKMIAEKELRLLKQYSTQDDAD